MKILHNGSIHVQKNDLGFLTQTDIPIPASIFLKVFGHGPTIIDNSNKFEFVQFDEPTEIDFFQSQDWIVDYNSVKDLSESEIINLGQATAAKRNAIADRYNSMTPDKRRQNYGLVEACERLEFKMHSLGDITMFKRGELLFDLPEGIERPRAIESAQNEEVVEVTRESVQTTSQTPQSNGIKRFFKSLGRPFQKK